jgi:hemerythrin-like domain-containing protein
MTGDMAEQVMVEHEMLQHIVDGLRRAIGMKAEGDDLSRKLHTVRFIAQSLQRHLDHMLQLEECDGYMEVVVERSPHLGRRVDVLRQEHEQFRKSARQVLKDLETVAPTDAVRFGGVCGDVLALLRRLESHTRKEVELLTESFDRDGGGEG